QKLGISKNVWLKLQGDFTLLALLATLYGLWQGAAWTPVAGLAFLGGLAVPMLYYLDALREAVAEDGLRALGLGLLLTQVKSWGWYLGFKKELLRHPKLFVKQVAEWRR
ncbi:MAG: hypothetical protein SV186_04840, partial [Candidatus Nanohaloarchaea archaeon]|nr:hypothetical protein [Candidatus Nanohaloarchaea archaeon]